MQGWFLIQASRILPTLAHLTGLQRRMWNIRSSRCFWRTKKGCPFVAVVWQRSSRWQWSSHSRETSKKVSKIVEAVRDWLPRMNQISFKTIKILNFCVFHDFSFRFVLYRSNRWSTLQDHFEGDSRWLSLDLLRMRLWTHIFFSEKNTVERKRNDRKK